MCIWMYYILCVQWADFVIPTMLIILFSIIFLDQANLQRLGGQL
jgi:hypothetical protein